MPDYGAPTSFRTGYFKPKQTIDTAAVRRSAAAEPNKTSASRMETLLMPTNFFDKLYASNKSTKKTIKHAILSHEEIARGFHGIVKQDPQYQGTIDFSTDDGFTFSAPAIGVVGNRIIQMRFSLSQYHVTPRIRGFGLDWYLPTGWVWADGLGTRTWEEDISNPLVLTRVVRSPSNPQSGVSFRVLISEKVL